MEEFNKYKLEVALCYYSQNNIHSFIDELPSRIEKDLYNISLSIYLNAILDRGNFIGEQEFFDSLNHGETK